MPWRAFILEWPGSPLIWETRFGLSVNAQVQKMGTDNPRPSREVKQ